MTHPMRATALLVLFCSMLPAGAQERPTTPVTDAMLQDPDPADCIIMAHDASSGEELWRTRTIPVPGEPGGDSWGDVPFEARWHVGTWMVPSYDPELQRVFIGTSVTSPAPKFMLGRNDYEYLYHNSTLALDAITGEIVWYYQHLVDHWDLDHPFERLLVDTVVAPDPDAVNWITPICSPAKSARWLPVSPARPASCTRSIARRISVRR